MKKTLLLFGFLAFTYVFQGQSQPSSVETYKNEIGLDATSFIKYYINFGQNEFSPSYSSNYFITYRRHLSKSNIRFAIGGDLRDNDIAPGFEADSNSYHNHSHWLALRIGWEKYTDMNTRWQVFYGIDFKPSFSYSKNDAPYWNGGYANGIESKTREYSIAPLLGFRYRLNQRISLSTEANLSINWRHQESRRYYIPVTSDYPDKPDDASPNIDLFFTKFNQPISIFITFDL